MATNGASQRSLFLSAVAVVLGGWAACRSGASAVPPPPPPSPAVVGLVDIQKVINGLDEFKARKLGLQADVDARQKELDAKTDSYKKAKADLDLLKPDSKERRNKFAELIEIEAQVKAKDQINTRLGQLDEGEIFGAMYTKALATIARVAIKGGYTLVLLDDRTVPIPKLASGSEMSGVIFSKRILFAENALDITDDIVTAMNSEFNAPAPRAGKPATSPAGGQTTPKQ